jgi:hypothetical protein
LRGATKSVDRLQQQQSQHGAMRSGRQLVTKHKSKEEELLPKLNTSKNGVNKNKYHDHEHGGKKKAIKSSEASRSSRDDNDDNDNDDKENDDFFLSLLEKSNVPRASNKWKAACE